MVFSNRNLLFKGGLFSGAMLVSGRVTSYSFVAHNSPEQRWGLPPLLKFFETSICHCYWLGRKCKVLVPSLKSPCYWVPSAMDESRLWNINPRQEPSTGYPTSDFCKVGQGSGEILVDLLFKIQLMERIHQLTWRASHVFIWFNKHHVVQDSSINSIRNHVQCLQMHVPFFAVFLGPGKKQDV